MERTFAGIETNYAQQENARIELIPVPYDGTSTWGKGADRGPEAFLEAAENMELYDIETDSEVYKQGIYLAEAVVERSSPESMGEVVQSRVREAISRNKFVTLFGGEHSISIGSIKAHAATYPDLTVLQIDAHADQRPEYEGSAYNHACAVHWAGQHTNLLQVGIRSMDSGEKHYMDGSKTWFAQQCHEEPDDSWMEKVLAKTTNNVYITIDLDAFDPSVILSTGTPEPGGLGWYQVLTLLRKVATSRTVVGFDIVELCPNGNERASAFAAAKLYYKLLSYIYWKK